MIVFSNYCWDPVLKMGSTRVWLEHCDNTVIKFKWVFPSIQFAANNHTVHPLSSPAGFLDWRTISLKFPLLSPPQSLYLSPCVPLVSPADSCPLPCRLPRWQTSPPTRHSDSFPGRGWCEIWKLICVDREERQLGRSRWKGLEEARAEGNVYSSEQVKTVLET